MVETVRRANLFLVLYHQDTSSATPDNVNSGWPPPSVTAATKYASKNSPHLSATAVNLSDDDEAIDRWVASAAGRQALIECDLYADVASATRRWAHLQTRPTKLGHRIFFA